MTAMTAMICWHSTRTTTAVEMLDTLPNVKSALAMSAALIWVDVQLVPLLF